MNLNLKVISVLITLFVMSYSLLSQEVEEKKKAFSITQEVVIDKVFTFNFAKSDMTELNSAMVDFLNKVVEFARQNPKTNIEISGHSDDQGTFQQNDERAKKRAENAKDVLLKAGIESKRIFAFSKASIEPIASNKTETGRKHNSRIEIKIVEKDFKRK